MISYFYVGQNLTAMDVNTAELLIYFINFILSTQPGEGQDIAAANKFSKLPPSLQTYNAATIASLILPEGYVPYTTEYADKTLPQEGAGEMVVSGKRRSYAAVEREEMSETIVKLQAQLELLQTEGVKQAPADDDDALELGLAIAALAVGVLALVVAVAKGARRETKQVKREVSFPKITTNDLARGEGGAPGNGSKPDNV